MSELSNDIRKLAEAIGVDVDEKVAALLALHVELVYAANTEFNLTRIGHAQAAELHVADSLLAAVALAGCPAGPFADLGSGAGFPGIPLALVSGRPVTLVESVKKKAAFLERCADELRLNSTVRAVRAEELAQTDAGAYAVVVARALSALPSLVELASPLLMRGGVLIAMKARPEPEELERGRAAGRLCGMVELRTEEVSIPGTDTKRTLVLYKKAAKAARTLPRRPGMAQRQPLA